MWSRDPSSIGGSLVPAVSPEVRCINPQTRLGGPRRRPWTCRTSWSLLCSWLPAEPLVAGGVTEMQLPLSIRRKFFIYLWSKTVRKWEVVTAFQSGPHWHSDWLHPLFEVEQLDSRAQQSSQTWHGPGIKPPPAELSAAPELDWFLFFPRSK